MTEINLDKKGIFDYLLKEIVYVLEDNGIPYHLCCGTLLGCIREGDFIKLYPVGRVGDVGSILINYIASPDDYGDSDVMTDGYSLDFLYKVVDYSVGRIRQEQAGE